MAKRTPAKTKDLPATHGMLFEVRDELKTSITGLEKKMESLFHQAMLRFEEQRSENKVVLEALQGISQRQDRLESEFIEVRDTVRTLAKTKPSKGRA